MQYSEPNFRQIATIHKRRLTGESFLSNCSISFIAHFYRSVSRFESTILLIEEDASNNVIGFAFCSTQKGKCFQSFLLANLHRLIVSPSAIASLMSSLLRRFKDQRFTTQYEEELVEIAVDAHCEHQGVALRLLRRCEEEFRSRGVTAFYLQVDGDNKRALNFYLRYGFQPVEQILVHSHMKHLMKKLIPHDRK